MVATYLVVVATRAGMVVAYQVVVAIGAGMVVPYQVVLENKLRLVVVVIDVVCHIC